MLEASSVQVCYDYATKQSIAMPESLRRALEAFEGKSFSKEVGA